MKTGELYTLAVEAHKLVKEDSFCSSCGCVLVQVDLPAGESAVGERDMTRQVKECIYYHLKQIKMADTPTRHSMK